MGVDLSPLWISLKVALVATVLTFGLGVAIAYRTLGYQGRWKPLLDGLCISPLILPPTVVGFLLLQLFGKQSPLGQLLSWLKIEIIFTWYAAAIAATIVTFPLMYRTALGAFAQIDGDLLRAARTLGASETYIFWRISLPLALPGIIAGATLSFARGLGEFGATLMLAGNIPKVTETIPLAIYRLVLVNHDFEHYLICDRLYQSLDDAGRTLSLSHLAKPIEEECWTRLYSNPPAYLHNASFKS
jgi:molybdate transport system permease protein